MTRRDLEFLLDALLRAESKTRSELYTAALNPVTGWVTRDEVRQRENLDPELARASRGTPTTGSQGGERRAQPPCP
jgi:hypothetical protein